MTTDHPYSKYRKNCFYNGEYAGLKELFAFKEGYGYGHS